MREILEEGAQAAFESSAFTVFLPPATVSRTRAPMMAPALCQAAIFFLLEIAFCTVGLVLAFLGDSIGVDCLSLFVAGFLFCGGGTETASAFVRKSNSLSRGIPTCPVLNECVIAKSLSKGFLGDRCSQAMAA